MPEVIKTNYLIIKDIKVVIPDLDLPNESPAQDKNVREPAEKYAPPEPVVRTIIKEVYRDPEPLTREDLERIYKKEIDEICRSAEQKAYDDALAEKLGEIESCVAEANKLMEEIRASQEQYMERYARELKYFAVEVAEKMILEKISEDDLILQKLILQVVEELKNSNWLKVEVSDRLTKLTDFLKNEFAKPAYKGRAAVLPSAVPDDTCRVSTENGTTDATISVQAENLRRIFSDKEQPENR